MASQRGNNNTRYYAKLYTFTLNTDAEVTIDLSSAQDTYLYLLRGHGPDGTEIDHDDDGGPGLNSRLSIDLTAGDYTIEATTYRRRTEGNFTLTVSTDIEAAECTVSVGTVSLGTPVSQAGTWVDSCELPAVRRSGNGTYYAKHYTFTLNTTAQVTVDLTASEDPYLFLLQGHGPDGTELHEDNDSGTGHNSRLSNVRLPAGNYTLSASTNHTERTGNFQVQVSAAAVPVTVTGLASSYGATVDEALNFAFTFDPSTATPSVRPMSQDGLELALTPNAGQLSVSGTPTKAGTYDITFRFTQGTHTDDHSTTINVVCPTGQVQQPDRTCQPTADVCVTPLGTLTVGTPASASGTWEDSCLLPAGRRSGRGPYYAKHYTFTLDADAVVTIDLTSTDQDTYLFLLRGHGPDGTEIDHDDDGGIGRNSRLTDVSLAAGDYTITSSTYSSQRTGNFQVRVEATALTVCTVPLGSGTINAQTLILGPDTGTWESSCVLPAGRRSGRGPYYAKHYTFTLDADAVVTIDLTSTDQDTYLFLLRGHGPDGTEIDHDDDGGLGLNSRLTRIDLAAGDYTITSSTYSSQRTGNFQIRAEALVPAACTTDLGVLGLDEVVSGGAWSASSGCVSLRRGNADSPNYARYYTFTSRELFERHNRFGIEP